MPYLSEQDEMALINWSTIMVWCSLEVQAGFRTWSITTVAIIAACRNVTHSANLQTNDIIIIIIINWDYAFYLLECHHNNII